MREIKVEDYLYDRADGIGGLCLKLNPLWYVGIPDRLLLLPGGHAVFVETKAPDGRVSQKQETWHMRLRKIGFHVYVLWNIDQVNGFFERYAKI